MVRVILSAIILLAASQAALAAGLCTGVIVPRESYREVVWDCTSNASGVASDTGGVVVYGVVMRIFFDADGDAVPKDLYDAELRTDAGEDILYDGAVNQGYDIPVAKSSPLRRRLPYDRNGDLIELFGETITPYLTNMGAAKRTTIKLRVW